MSSAASTHRIMGTTENSIHKKNVDNWIKDCSVKLIKKSLSRRPAARKGHRPFVREISINAYLYIDRLFTVDFRFPVEYTSITVPLSKNKKWFAEMNVSCVYGFNIVARTS